MPSASGRQHGFAGVSSTRAGRAKLRAEGRKPMPPKVAKDFLRADRGRKFAQARGNRKAHGLINRRGGKR